MISCAVAGASGYAGGEILRLLLSHPEVSVGALTAASSAGTRLDAHHPNLPELADRVLQETTAEVLAGHDVVFLALPHGASAAVVQELGDEVVLIDCGADFRLEDPQAWEQFYGSEHAGTWTYGLPELPIMGPSGSDLKQRHSISQSRRIAVPGCYPTSVSLALAPLLHAGVVEPDDIVVVAASGTSGAGKSLKPHLLGAEVMGAMSPYGVGGGHRHTPEMEQNLGRAGGKTVTLSFTPTLAPMPRGILATCTAKLRDGYDEGAARRAIQGCYGKETFITLLPAGRWPNTGAVLGSNSVQVQVAVDPHVGRVIVVAAIDNLTKGTAGGAVQCMNLVLGLPETTGLPRNGIAP